jgi:hypothetical protein
MSWRGKLELQKPIGPKTRGTWAHSSRLCTHVTVRYEQELQEREAHPESLSHRVMEGLETYDFRADPDFMGSFALDSAAIRT